MAAGHDQARCHQEGQFMTSFFTAAPGYCSRFGVAVLLVVLADFLFYGQPDLFFQLHFLGN